MQYSFHMNQLDTLADRYGFVQKGIQNMNAEDPSQKLTKIVKEIRDSNANIFFM